MACIRDGNGVFFCQETVDFFADRLSQLFGPEIAEAIRADPVQLELSVLGVLGVAVMILLLLFGTKSEQSQWWWWRH